MLAFVNAQLGDSTYCEPDSQFLNFIGFIKFWREILAIWWEYGFSQRVTHVIPIFQSKGIAATV